MDLKYTYGIFSNFFNFNIRITLRLPRDFILLTGDLARDYLEILYYQQDTYLGVTQRFDVDQFTEGLFSKHNKIYLVIAHDKFARSVNLQIIYLGTSKPYHWVIPILFQNPKNQLARVINYLLGNSFVRKLLFFSSDKNIVVLDHVAAIWRAQ